MADPRFDYPTAASPTNSLVFAQGGQLWRDAVSIAPKQVKTVTMGGSVMVDSLGDSSVIHPFTARFKSSSLTEADYDDVKEFIDEIVQWALNSFQWTDENGTVRTVRIWNEKTSFPEFTYDEQQFVFLLREENS